MKKLFFFVLIPVVLAFSLCNPLVAQEDLSESENPVKKAREDYLFQYAKYNEAYELYLTKKEANEKFQTISSQQEAITATKEVLTRRAEVLRTYLQLLKFKILAQGQLDPGTKESQTGKIEATQAFLTTHKTSIERFRSIAEINSESKRLERESSAINNLAYESLCIILIGQAQGLEYRSGQLLEKIIREKKLEDNQNLKLPISEARRMLTEVRVNIDRSSQLVVSIQYETRRKETAEEVYEEVRKEMLKAKATLGQAMNLIQNIEKVASNE
jgi:hypothetical protein